jgi:hypothetical protein
MTRTYIGPTSKAKGMRNGETATYRASFTAPPKIIQPGETIGTRLTLEAVQIDLDFFDFKGSARALRDGTNLENADGRYNFTLGKKQGYGTIEEVLTAKAPRGSAGKKMKLQFQLYTADTMRTIYVYEYR